MSPQAAPETTLRKNEVLSTVAGFLIIGLVIYGTVVAGQAIYARLSPPATLSLAADLEEVPNGHFGLHVIGSVQRSGKPLTGQVLLSVQRLWEGSPQTIDIPLVDGRFELRQDRQFTFESRDDRLLISAEAWTIELPSRPARAEVYVNATGPWRYKRVLWSLFVATLALLAIVFFAVFTGRGSPLKNRIAIVLSYCIMLLFLTIPLTVTNIALVLAAPDFRRMEQAPVGIVIAKPWGAKVEDPPQWVLNIGGHVRSAATPAANTPPTIPPQTATTVANVVPSTTATPPNTSVEPSAISATATTGTANAAQRAAVPPEISTGGGSVIEPSQVEGGIAVPFYVLVLAVIGGAINMARQIPRYHQEGERSVLEFTPLRSAAKAVRGVFGGPETEEAPEEGEGASDDKQDSNRRADDNNWRKGLLDQYMYLISAPFLAIVTYFLLAWLGITTVPALVLVSFSVGLITEPVIQRIIDAAQSTFGKQKQESNKDQQNAEAPLDEKRGAADELTETDSDQRKASAAGS